MHIPCLLPCNALCHLGTLMNKKTFTSCGPSACTSKTMSQNKPLPPVDYLKSLSQQQKAVIDTVPLVKYFVTINCHGTNDVLLGFLLIMAGGKNSPAEEAKG